MYRFPGINALDLIEELKKNPDIEYVEPNFVFHADVVPNDPEFNKQRGGEQHWPDGLCIGCSY